MNTVDITPINNTVDVTPINNTVETRLILVETVNRGLMGIQQQEGVEAIVDNKE